MLNYLMKTFYLLQLTHAKYNSNIVSLQTISDLAKAGGLWSVHLRCSPLEECLHITCTMMQKWYRLHCRYEIHIADSWQLFEPYYKLLIAVAKPAEARCDVNKSTNFLCFSFLLKVTAVWWMVISIISDCGGASHRQIAVMNPPPEDNHHSLGSSLPRWLNALKTMCVYVCVWCKFVYLSAHMHLKKWSSVQRTCFKLEDSNPIYDKHGNGMYSLLITRSITTRMME